MIRRGIVWIAPRDPRVPAGRMVDPVRTVFWASWQDGGPLENVHVIGAEQAIAWGRDRAQHVLIRLGQTDETYFSAGDAPEVDLPRWPPSQPPAAGWWLTAEPVSSSELGPSIEELRSGPQIVGQQIDDV